MTNTIIATHIFTTNQLVAYRTGTLDIETLPAVAIEVSPEIAALLELVDNDEEYSDDEDELLEDGDGEEVLEEDDEPQEVQDNSWLYENC